VVNEQPTPSDRATRASVRRQVAFVGHQLVEYGLAIALLIVAAEQRGSVGLVLAVVGGLLGALALTTKSRLGVFRFLPLPVHHALDVVLALLCASSPAWALGVLHLPGSIAAEIMAALLLWMERLTSYRDRPRRPPAPARAATGTSLVGNGTVTHQVIHRSARQLGTATGVTRRLMRERAKRRGDS
jgi:ABC-type xylose transport system permease subunit